MHLGVGNMHAHAHVHVHVLRLLMGHKQSVLVLRANSQQSAAHMHCPPAQGLVYVSAWENAASAMEMAAVAASELRAAPAAPPALLSQPTATSRR